MPSVGLEDIDFTLENNPLEYVDREYLQIFNGNCFSLIPHCLPPPDEKVRESCHVRNMGTVYSVDKFNEQRDPPLSIGKVCPDTFEKLNISVVDLLVKVAGDDVYYIPDELLPLKATLQLAIDFFHSHNASAMGSYYCTVRTSCCLIPPNGIQRFKAIHADGVLGPRYQDHRGNYHRKDCSI
eukprot:CAMPEP_0114484738 /NCGR_PEP_ID=MMETSP0104-20121206/19582_1 /TAXON_ID=37642 ORGANISM="Paraphysomonas imperforata, Strain PA2" /NCGR_SAMPLE_ID=MMETSP0104 /ASSEMBLY_ACC=CAM_ASM_000202 /LENGTH=181 /DNA_ID=CAMNT_0001660823 /DNA_START=9 /DNA_END=551 /DNA_ORIENTATION=-